jgi:acyl carrier protein phosphodiesterase
MHHRAIDEFTDAHPATKKAITFFHPAYRLYSGAFVDVVYDHFLTLDKNEFKDTQTLQKFTVNVYKTLDENFSLLPVRFQNILPHMKQHNWLFNYQYRDGIEKSFGGLVYRAAYMNESATAFDIFNKNYAELKDCYYIFFPTLKKFAAQYLATLLA